MAMILFVAVLVFIFYVVQKIGGGTFYPFQGPQQVQYSPGLHL